MVKSSLTKLTAILFLALLMTACKSGTQESETQTQTQTPTQPTEKAERTAKKPRRPRAETRTVTVPAGTALAIRLNTEISTGRTPAGATFEGTLTEPLAGDGVEVASVGSAVTGKVTRVVSSGRLNRPAELSLVLTSLTPQGGSPVDISTAAWGEKGKSHKKRDIEMIGGGGGVGALIGALTGGKKGAAIGGAIGAGGGTAAAAATGKKEIVLPPETKINFELNAPISITVPAK
jgi:hypothetical protein